MKNTRNIFNTVNIFLSFVTLCVSLQCGSSVFIRMPDQKLLSRDFLVSGSISQVHDSGKREHLEARQFPIIALAPVSEVLEPFPLRHPQKLSSFGVPPVHVFIPPGWLDSLRRSWGSFRRSWNKGVSDFIRWIERNREKIENTRRQVVNKLEDFWEKLKNRIADLLGWDAPIPHYNKLPPITQHVHISRFVGSHPIAMERFLAEHTPDSLQKEHIVLDERIVQLFDGHLPPLGDVFEVASQTYSLHIAEHRNFQYDCQPNVGFFEEMTNISYRWIPPAGAAFLSPKDQVVYIISCEPKSE